MPLEDMTYSQLEQMISHMFVVISCAAVFLPFLLCVTQYLVNRFWRNTVFADMTTFVSVIFPLFSAMYTMISSQFQYSLWMRSVLWLVALANMGPVVGLLYFRRYHPKEIERRGSQEHPTHYDEHRFGGAVK